MNNSWAYTKYRLLIILGCTQYKIHVLTLKAQEFTLPSCSSIMADKLIHELGYTFSTFPYQGLGLNKFTCVVYAGDNSVVTLWCYRQVGDEINAKLSPGFKRYMYRFQLISTISKFGTSLHMLASFTAQQTASLCYAWEVNFGCQ